MKHITFIIIFLAVSLFSSQSIAKVRLPAVVGDSMVLQRDVKLKIWGWADKNEVVEIRFKGKKYSATTQANGRWMIWLPAMPAGGPYTMNIVGKENTITLQDILIGDVWLCAGQSNMVHSFDLHQDRYRHEINQANYPQIRQFLVPVKPLLTGPVDDLPDANWKAATPKNILRFSVVAYFFAKNLYQQYKVPIGIINASVGGTPIEAWISEEGLQTFPEVLTTVQTNKDTSYVNKINKVASLRNQEIARA